MRIFSPGREGCTGVRLSCWAQLAILPGEYKITEIMIDLNNWYKQYQENPDRVEFEMAQSAARELFDAVQENYYGFDELKHINYSEVCEWLGWPDLQDRGIFEQAINTAANMVLGVLKYKPQHNLE